MVRPFPTLVACAVALLSPAAPAGAQMVPGFDTVLAAKQECEGEEGRRHCTLTGAVELQRDDWKFYADHAEYFEEKHLLVATGNVSFAQASNRMSAERAEFDTEDKTGTFYVAFGSAALGDRVDASMFGGQEPDMYFYGETIEKIGERKYRVTRGGFTTCVQPTPRWELTSGTAVISLEHYAYLRNTVLKVKDVPMFYIPALFYPLKKENRATGFLLPMYGTSTLQGMHLGNAFFWAISRSQDATIYHDLFTKTGQGYGGEYRYIQGPASSGNASVYVLQEHPYDVVNSAGGTTPVAGQKSYRIRSSVSQGLGRHLRASGRVDYFSSVRVQQTYNANYYDATQRQRSLGGVLAGNWGSYGVNASFDRSEYFFGETSSIVSGNAPRVSVTRAERPIGRTPVYFTFGADFADLVQIARSGTNPIDTSLSRANFSPRIRFPFTRLSFLTVNTSVGMLQSWWNQSLDPVTGAQVEVPLTRRYYDVDSRVVGPVFSRVFSGPKHKAKHVIEPNFSIRRTTAIDNYNEIVKRESADYTIGGMTQMTYGITNRLLVKGAEQGARSREVLSVGITQSYYTDARASLYDSSYSTAYRSATATKFSNIAMTARTVPTDRISGSFRMEWDPNIGVLQSISANASGRIGEWLAAGGGWSHRRNLIAAYAEYDSLTADATVTLLDKRVGGYYAFNYDLGRKFFVQNRVTAFYNTQCCGFAFEFQTFNYTGLQVLGNALVKDRRFNFSFTLAGLGTFSNLLGVFGGMGGNGTGSGLR